MCASFLLPMWKKTTADSFSFSLHEVRVGRVFFFTFRFLFAFGFRRCCCCCWFPCFESRLYTRTLINQYVKINFCKCMLLHDDDGFGQAHITYTQLYRTIFCSISVYGGWWECFISNDKPTERKQKNLSLLNLFFFFFLFHIRVKIALIYSAWPNTFEHHWAKVKICVLVHINVEFCVSRVDGLSVPSHIYIYVYA